MKKLVIILIVIMSIVGLVYGHSDRFDNTINGGNVTIYNAE